MQLGSLYPRELAYLSRTQSVQSKLVELTGANGYQKDLDFNKRQGNTEIFQVPDFLA